MHLWILEATFCVQLAALGALVWYTLETMKIRKASQDQAEALHEPCLTLLSEAREADAAILDLDDAVGGMIIAARNGNVGVHNVGSGPAINIKYRLEPIDPPPGANVDRPDGYLQIIAVGQKFIMPVSRGLLGNQEFRFVATYDSLSGRHYESHITIKNMVLTGSSFRTKATSRAT